MSYDVQIRRQSLYALFDLKGAPSAIQSWCGDILPKLPEMPNTRRARGNIEVYFIGNHHWIVRAPLELEGVLNTTLRPTDCPADISIVCVSDTLIFFHVVGPQAAEVMSIACPLDMHDAEFSEEATTFTEVFGLKALVMRCEKGFEIAIEQSFGDMMEDYLSRATA